MARFALVENSYVTALSEANTSWSAPGWIAIDNAPVDIGWRYINTQFVPPAKELTVFDFEVALSKHLDEVAHAKRYDNRISCAVRAGYPGPFQVEGQAFAVWMDNCNAVGYTYLQQLANGEITLPETTVEFIATLPAPPWPKAS